MNKPQAPRCNPVRRARGKPGAARLRKLIEQATVDCYNDSEAASGFLTMIDDHLGMPFSTTVLGVEVSVERVDITPGGEIVAVCNRGKLRQGVPILDLVLPSPPPPGSEWIDAYRAWLAGS